MGVGSGERIFAFRLSCTIDELCQVARSSTVASLLAKVGAELRVSAESELRLWLRPSRTNSRLRASDGEQDEEGRASPMQG